MHLVAIGVLALIGALGGGLGPRLIARIPEPVVETDEPARPAEPSQLPKAGVAPKTPYVEIAAAPGLAAGLASGGLVVGAAVGWRLGWSGALLPWSYLVPLGVVLGYVDWRTKLLPTWVVAPSYAVMTVLVLAGAALDGHTRPLVGAAGGWLAIGAIYLLMWLVFPAGMGYGDVRFSGLLGMALGYVGWAQVAAGWYAGIALGAIIGVALALLRIVDRRELPFGPFMMLGAVVGLLAGAPIAHALGY